MRLIHGDCLEEMDKLKKEGIKANLILTDLPYGTTQCKWDTVIPFGELWGGIKSVRFDNTPIVLFGSEPFSSALRMSNIKEYKYDWKWVKNKKTGFLNAKKQPLRQTEDIMVFYSKQPFYSPQKSKGHKPVNSYTKNTSDGETLGKTTQGFSGGGSTERYPSNVLHFPVVNNDNSGGDKLYPTQKPVKLMEYLIKTYTNDGDLVLDLTAGSFTVSEACKNLNRDCIAIEKGEIGYNIGMKRIYGD